jgi:hypothetical protein
MQGFGGSASLRSHVQSPSGPNVSETFLPRFSRGRRGKPRKSDCSWSFCIRAKDSRLSRSLSRLRGACRRGHSSRVAQPARLLPVRQLQRRHGGDRDRAATVQGGPPHPKHQNRADGTLGQRSAPGGRPEVIRCRRLGWAGFSLRSRPGQRFGREHNWPKSCS